MLIYYCQGHSRALNCLLLFKEKAVIWTVTLCWSIVYFFGIDRKHTFVEIGSESHSFKSLLYVLKYLETLQDCKFLSAQFQKQRVAFFVAKSAIKSQLPNQYSMQ